MLLVLLKLGKVPRPSTFSPKWQGIAHEPFTLQLVLEVVSCNCTSLFASASPELNDIILSKLGSHVSWVLTASGCQLTNNVRAPCWPIPL